MSKPQALLTGSLSAYTCELVLAVDGMGKKLTMQLSSVKTETLDKGYESALTDEKDQSSAADQNQ